MRFLLFLSLLVFGFKANAVNTKQADTVTKVIFTTYYAKKFEGKRTSSGERYSAAKFTAAHRTLPFGTIVTVKNLHNGKTVDVRINDRGPFNRKFSLDISKAAATAIGVYRLGYAKVEISYIN